MRKSKKNRLEAAGWKVGTVREFLDLSPEEAEFIALKLALANYLKALRKNHGWTRSHVAKLIRANQSRVEKMEASDASVSVDLLLRSLLVLDASRQDVAKVIGTSAA